MDYVFSLIAGLLTTLSPCVLPVLPFVTASSLNKHRLAPLVLGLGLSLSFVAVTFAISSSGALLGLDGGVLRKIAGISLAASGLLFIFPSLFDRFSEKMAFLSRLGPRQASGSASESRPLWTEFASGALLGVVWTPCSGPSLGAALGLAAKGQDPVRALAVLSVFGLGSMIPLVAVAYGAKSVFTRLRQNAGAIGAVKKVFGVLIVLFGVMIVFELDRHLEAHVNDLLPDSWIEFVTRY